MLIKKLYYPELLSAVVKMYGSLERLSDFILVNDINDLNDYDNLSTDFELYANEYKFIEKDYQFNEKVTENPKFLTEIQRKYIKQNFLDCILTNYGSLDDGAFEDFLVGNKINDLESFNNIEAGTKLKVNKDYPSNFIFGRIVKTDYIIPGADYNNDYNEDFLI